MQITNHLQKSQLLAEHLLTQTGLKLRPYEAMALYAKQKGFSSWNALANTSGVLGFLQGKKSVPDSDYILGHLPGGRLLSLDRREASLHVMIDDPMGEQEHGVEILYNLVTQGLSHGKSVLMVEPAPAGATSKSKMLREDLRSRCLLQGIPYKELSLERKDSEGIRFWLPMEERNVTLMAQRLVALLIGTPSSLKVERGGVFFQALCKHLEHLMLEKAGWSFDTLTQRLNTHPHVQDMIGSMAMSQQLMTQLSRLKSSVFGGDETLELSQMRRAQEVLVLRANSDDEDFINTMSSLLSVVVYQDSMEVLEEQKAVPLILSLQAEGYDSADTMGVMLVERARSMGIMLVWTACPHQPEWQDLVVLVANSFTHIRVLDAAGALDARIAGQPKEIQFSLKP